MPEDLFTFMMVKSHLFGNDRALSNIFERADAAGLKYKGAMTLELPKKVAEELYAEHVGRPYFAGLIKSVTSAPVTVALLFGKDATHRWRTLLGATDPAKAEPGTIRGDYGIELPHNACHGSDSPASAERERALFYSPAFIEALK